MTLQIFQYAKILYDVFFFIEKSYVSYKYLYIAYVA